MLRLALSAALLLVTVLPAAAQTCYVGRNGDIVDLGSMCSGPTEDRTQPIAAPGAQGSTTRNPAATPFPSYLFDRDVFNDETYQTNQVQQGNSTLFVYEGRFVKRFTEWPHTVSATNHAEWGYVDCATGWRGLDSSPFVGSREPLFIPPAASTADELTGLRNRCTAAGVTPRF